MPKQVSITAFVISLVASALVGAGVMFLTFQTSPATFARFVNFKPKIEPQTTPPAGDQQKTAQTTNLTAAPRAVGVILKNTANNSQAQVELGAQLKIIDGVKTVEAQYITSAFWNPDEDTFMSTINSKNIDKYLQDFEKQIRTQVLEKVNLDQPKDNKFKRVTYATSFLKAFFGEKTRFQYDPDPNDKTVFWAEFFAQRQEGIGFWESIKTSWRDFWHDLKNAFS